MTRFMKTNLIDKLNILNFFVVSWRLTFVSWKKPL